MILLGKLKLNYFGRFQNREIELKPGINLIYGENEAGKSTIHTFIKGMLFGIERMRGRGAASKEDLYTRYLPWDYPGAFGGSMDLMIGDKEYRLQRSFHANDKSFNVLELATGREVKLKEGLISELIPGLSESAFKNTVSIEQLKARTDSELALQVRNYIANLSIAKSKEVNVAKAVSYLTEQKKLWEPSQNTTVLKALQSKIDDGMEKEERMDGLTLRLKELLGNQQQLREQQEAAAVSVDCEEADRMEELPAIMEKYRNHQEMCRRMEQLEEQNKGVQEQIAELNKEQISTRLIGEDIARAKQLQQELQQQEALGLELESKAAGDNAADLRNRVIGLTLPVLTAVITILFTGFTLSGILTGSILIGLGLAAFWVLNQKIRKKQKIQKETQEQRLQRREAADSALNELFQKYRVGDLEQLIGIQEAAVKNYYSLENALQKKSEYDQRIKELEDEKELIYESIMKYIQLYFPVEELEPDTMQRLQEVIRSRKQKNADKLSVIKNKYESCSLEIEKLRWEIAALEENEKQLLRSRERYQEAVSNQREGAAELEAIKLALSTIQELSTEIHDSFGQQLNQRVSEVISEVTGERYQDLKVDEKLGVKVGWSGSYVLLERLSAGTMDQVYFALRLAVAELLLGTEVPLLLDDSFSLYDETRIKAALQQISDRNQVILFTCHKREQQLLDELGLSYNYINLSA